MVTPAIKKGTLSTGAVEGQFKIAAIGEGKCTLASYNRRDFFKISLVTDGRSNSLQYGSAGIFEGRPPAIVFLNPQVPYSWKSPGGEEETQGYFCVFNDAFIGASAELVGFSELLFSAQQSPVYFLDNRQREYMVMLFRRMREAADTDYVYKDELFRSHLSLVFHEAILMRQLSDKERLPKAEERIATQFLRLLNAQFPVDLPAGLVGLKKASDFSDQIAVHVNHLNTAVQKATGKSTTAHINERLIAEARSLLCYTDHSVSDISFGLGFEYQTYFNRFFKKHTGMTPMELRKRFGEGKAH